MKSQMKINNLLTKEIKALYSAEQQLIQAMPNMIEAANEAALKKAFTNHLKETEKQAERLEKVAKLLDTAPSGKKCEGMAGIIEEGKVAIREDGDPIILDLGIIAAASRVEHYEISAYMTAISLAECIAELEVASLLKESLAGEQLAEKNLRQIANNLINTAPV